MRLPHPNQKSRNVINSLNDDIADGSSCTLREAILAAKNAPANAG